MPSRIHLICLGLILLFSCQEPLHQERGIYYWKSSFKTKPEEVDYLKRLKINRLFLHLFDVKMHEGKAVPEAKIFIDSDIPDFMEIIPVIYITNETMISLNRMEINELSSKIHSLSTSLLAKHALDIQEFQFDCDWTEKSKENYFYFLSCFRKLISSTTKISATIRLHQVKFKEKTGIPPVDRGMLMFYNMGKLKDYHETNSIYNKSTAETYLENGLSYPLPLDATLAIYSWGMLFRLGQATTLLSNLTEEELVNDKLCVKSNQHQYKITKDHLLHGEYLQAGDEIRIENITSLDAQESSAQLSNRWINRNFTLAVYHWHSYFFKTIQENELEKVYFNFN